MSLDLLEAFGLDAAASSTSNTKKSETKIGQAVAFGVIGSAASLDGRATDQQTLRTTTAEEDDWGDFEDGTEKGGSKNNSLGRKDTAPSTASRYRYELNELGPSTVSIEPSRKQEGDLLGHEFEKPPTKNAAVRNIPVGSANKSTDNPDVLFDASQDESEDDFGDFEDSLPTKASKPSHQSVPEIDLLSLDDPPVLSHSKAKPTSIDLEIESTKPTAQETNDETWDDFSQIDDNLASNSTNNPSTVMEYSSFKGSADPASLNQNLSGISIPPPSVLLSAFVSIVEKVEKELLQPLAAREANIRQQILADPKTAEYARGYLLVMAVCGHIIAGRKLRWKRDTVLAQSMRIGSAASGRAGGMKLTTVDKTEVTKEEREVAEVLRVWNRQLGKIKSIAVEAKKAGNSDVGPVPELRENMSVKTSKQSQGGIPSRKPCLLCGLKRDERVDKVGLDVQDSFGDWWVEESNMHRCCRNFWAEYEPQMRQR